MDDYDHMEEAEIANDRIQELERSLEAERLRVEMLENEVRMARRCLGQAVHTVFRNRAALGEPDAVSVWNWILGLPRARWMRMVDGLWEELAGPVMKATVIPPVALQEGEDPGPGESRLLDRMGDPLLDMSRVYVRHYTELSEVMCDRLDDAHNRLCWWLEECSSDQFVRYREEFPGDGNERAAGRLAKLRGENAEVMGRINGYLVLHTARMTREMNQEDARSRREQDLLRSKGGSEA